MLQFIKDGIKLYENNQVDDLDIKLSALANVQSGVKPVII